MKAKRYAPMEIMKMSLCGTEEFVASSDYETILARDNIRTFAEQEVRIAELEKTLLASAEETRTAFQATLELGFEVKELREQLARVKAESLRVVKCGEVCELQDCMSEYCFIEGKDRLNFASEFAKQHYPTMRVQPVRLERWENESQPESNDKYAGKPAHDVRGWEPN